jgi:hypothetical protein
VPGWPTPQPPPPHAAPPAVAPPHRPPEIGNVTVIASVDELRENAQRIASKSVAPPMGAPMPIAPGGNPQRSIQGETTARPSPAHPGHVHGPAVVAHGAAPFDPGATPPPGPALEQIFAMPTNLAEKGQIRGNATVKWAVTIVGVAILAGAGYFAYLQMQVKSAAQIRREVARTTRKPPPPADRIDDRPAVVILQTAGDGKADERTALKQLLDGRLVEARTSYEQLAVAFPQDHRFAVMASIIERELARRCKPGSSLVNEMCIDIAAATPSAPAAPVAPAPPPATP